MLKRPWTESNGRTNIFLSLSRLARNKAFQLNGQNWMFPVVDHSLSVFRISRPRKAPSEEQRLRNYYGVVIKIFFFIFFTCSMDDQIMNFILIIIERIYRFGTCCFVTAVLSCECVLRRADILSKIFGLRWSVCLRCTPLFHFPSCSKINSF